MDDSLAAKISSELVSLVRGEIPQEKLNDRHNFSYNKIHRWEKGLRKIYWDDFVQLCRFCKRDLRKAIKTSLYLNPYSLEGKYLLKQLHKAVSRENMLAILDCSERTLVRFESGNQPVFLKDMLKLFHVNIALDYFSRSLVGAIPASLKPAVELDNLLKEYIYDHPHAMLIGYMFDVGFPGMNIVDPAGAVALYLGLDPSIAREVVEWFKANGFLSNIGSTNKPSWMMERTFRLRYAGDFRKATELMAWNYSFSVARPRKRNPDSNFGRFRTVQMTIREEKLQELYGAADDFIAKLVSYAKDSMTRTEEDKGKLIVVSSGAFIDNISRKPE